MTSPFGNHILDALPELEAAAVRPHLKRVHLELGEVLYVTGEPFPNVYFPAGAVLSVLTLMRDGAAIEIGTFGWEGLSGTQLVLDEDRSPHQMICQIAGAAQVMAPVQKYMVAFINFMAQSVACNRLHTVEERCARWLLLTHDRVKGDTFESTQEFLAMMLGVHRPGVTVAAGALQEAGLIRYRRGSVEIRDREGLESASCECYRANADAFQAVVRGAKPGPSRRIGSDGGDVKPQ